MLTIKYLPDSLDKSFAKKKKKQILNDSSIDLELALFDFK